MPSMIGMMRSPQPQLDLRLDVRQVVLVEAVEVQDPLVVGHVIGPLDVLAEVAVAGDRHQAELLQDHLEDAALGPGFGLDIGEIFGLLGPLPGLLEVFVHRGHRGHVAEERRRFGADIGVGVLAGGFVFGRQHAAEVVQAGRPHLQRLIGHAQDARQEVGQRARSRGTGR